MSPEKLHLALNHLVFLLPLVAIIPLSVGLLRKNQTCMICGVLIAILGSVATGFVMSTGENAFERYQNGPVTMHLDSDFHAVLEKHEEVGHSLSKIMYLLLFVAVLAAISAYLRPVVFPYLVGAVIILCLASGIAGILIADTGGEIRRPDFRATPPIDGLN